MTTVAVEQLIPQIHAAGVRMVIAVTGGGSSAISDLLAVPGASRSVLAAVVPYASQALVEWLGGAPDEYCSTRTARAMAMAAYQKAVTYDPAARTCGLACTASLASDRPKRGAHRAHLAWQSASTTACLSLELAKDRRSRAGEEQLVSELLLNLIAEACGVDDRLAVELAEGEQPETSAVVAPMDQQDLLAGRVETVAAGAALEAGPPRAVFSGAFNPLHAGHRQMAEVAATILGHAVAFEISVLNVDKPPLDFIEIDRRLRQFSPDQAVWLSRAARFTQKADLFGGVTFAVGADTIERIGQPRYYGGSQIAADEAIAKLAARGCQFLVFGRVRDGKFAALADLQLPSNLRALCREVPESLFREDVSSTELRRRQATS